MTSTFAPYAQRNPKNVLEWVKLLTFMSILMLPASVSAQLYGPGTFERVEMSIETVGWVEQQLVHVTNTIVFNEPVGSIDIVESRFPNGQVFGDAAVFPHFTGTLKFNYPATTPPTDPSTFVFNPLMSASLNLTGNWKSPLGGGSTRTLLSNPTINGSRCRSGTEIDQTLVGTTPQPISIQSDCNEIFGLDGGPATNPKEVLRTGHALAQLSNRNTANAYFAYIRIQVVYRARLLPQIGLNPVSLPFEFTTFGPSPAAKTLTLTNAGGQTLNWTASITNKTGGNWLKVSPASGSLAEGLSANLDVSVDPTGLAPGDYEGTVTVNGNASTGPKSTTVRLKVIEGRPKGQLTVNRTELEFFNTVTFPQQDIVLHNPSTNVVHWFATRTVENDGRWLFTGPTGGSIQPGGTTMVAVIIIAPSTLALGPHKGKLTFQPNLFSGAADFPPVDVAVTYNVLDTTDELKIDLTTLSPDGAKPLRQGMEESFNALVSYKLASRSEADLALRIFDEQGVLQGSSEFKRVTRSENSQSAQLRIEPFLITTNSNGKYPQKLVLRAVMIDRLQAQVFAVTPDISYAVEPKAELLALEVNQVVQDWNNSVPLFENKPTYVRAHVQAKGDEHVVVENALLRGFSNGVELANSPQRPINPGGRLSAGTNLVANPERRAFFGTSLNFRLPPEWTAGRVVLQFEAPGVGCKETLGTPEDCSVEVTFKPNPKIEVKFINIQWTNNADQTLFVSDAELKEEAAKVVSIYPLAAPWDDYTSALHVWPTNKALTLDNALLELTELRNNDGCGADCKRLYAGLIKGLPALTDGGALGRAYLDGTVGANGVKGQGNFGYSRHVVGHEMAHNLGRRHSVSGTQPLVGDEKQGWCGETGARDAEDFPYSITIDTDKHASLGPMDKGINELIFGLDTFASPPSVISPWKNFDLMSYCPGLDSRFKWPSKHTYEKIINALDSRFPASLRHLHAPGARGNYLIVSGAINLALQTAEFLPFSLLIDADPPPSLPEGAYELQLQDANGAVIQRLRFAPLVPEADGIGPVSLVGHFSIPVLANPAFRKAVLLHNGAVLASRNASPGVPAVQVLAPNGGEIASDDPLVVRWKGTDADGDPLLYNVQISFDGGATWESAAVNRSQESCEIPQRQLRATSRALIRVTARDGFHVGADVSDAVFSIPNHAPILAIQSPSSGYLFTGSQEVVFAAEARDQDDDRTRDVTVRWTSDRDGVIGQGLVLHRNAASLTEGNHVITADATDSTGANSTATVRLTISRAVPETLADLELREPTVSAPSPAGGFVDFTVTLVNHGPNQAEEVKLTNSLPEGVLLISSSSAGTCVQNGREIVCTVKELLAGQSTNVTYRVTKSTAGPSEVRVTVGSATIDQNPSNNTLSEVITVMDTVTASFSLSVVQEGNRLRLSWPASATGWVLQSTESLSARAVWTPVTDLVPVVGSTNEITVTVPAANKTRFYRLVRP